MTFSSPQRTWWKEAMVYQVWPASFKSTSGSGIGDLQGVISELDHIKQLGTGIIWISPCFKSPQVDMGYDVSDYKEIHAPYGTMADLDELIAAVHERGMKIILDFVLNHTSEEHEWFKESRSSLDNPKRDWYHWQKGTTDPNTGEKLQPNNWQSIFHGKAWEYDQLTDEWYMHLFVKQQPDLNWDNPEVREALFDIARFWLDKGCDGFRLDAVQFCSKPTGYTDAPITQAGFLQPIVKHVAHGPKIHEYMREFGEVLSAYDCYTVGETAGTNDPKVLLEYIRPENKELNTVFHFELAEIDGSHEDPVIPHVWKLPEFREITSRWQREMIQANAWNAIYLENHDQARMISRYASDLPEFRTVSGTMLAMHLATLCGTIFVYQGQELGQINAGLDWPIEEYKDVGSINLYADHLDKRRKEQGKGDVDMKDVMLALKNKARDHARVPVHWNDDEHTGHKGKPWMRMHSDYKEWNAASQAKNPESVLSFYKKMFKTRKENDVLIYGDYHDLSLDDNEQLFVYRRDLEGRTALVVLNFSKTAAPFVIPSLDRPLENARLLIGNYSGSEGTLVEGGTIQLKPFEGRVYLLA